MLHLPSHAGCYVGLVAVVAGAAAAVEPAAAEGPLAGFPFDSFSVLLEEAGLLPAGERSQYVSSGGGRYASCSSRRTLTANVEPLEGPGAFVVLQDMPQRYYLQNKSGLMLVAAS